MVTVPAVETTATTQASPTSSTAMGARVMTAGVTPPGRLADRMVAQGEELPESVRLTESTPTPPMT